MFKCPKCQSELPEVQRLQGSCPYCEETWAVDPAKAGKGDISSTLNISDLEDDSPSDSTPESPADDTSKPADIGGTLILGTGSSPEPPELPPEDGRTGGTIELPRDEDAGESPSMQADSEGPASPETGKTIDLKAPVAGGEAFGTVQLPGDAGHQTIDLPPGAMENKTVQLPPQGQGGGDPGDTGQTVELPSDQDIGQTVDLPSASGIDQTIDLSSQDPMQTVDLDQPGGGSGNNMVTFGSKPLTASDVKRFWAGAAADSPLTSLRTATVSKAKELGVEIRQRIISNNENDSDYTLIDELGKGGMGIVYAATQKSLSRKVAVKTLQRGIGDRQDERGKFLGEAVITGLLDHPNIVPIHDLGQTEDGTLFYSMKCVTGVEWHRVIRKKNEAENLEILRRIADAVAFAHSRNVIHRDLKPENVMLGEYGEVLVMDWGLAVDLSRDEEFTMGGTPAYMAPEMAKGPLDRIGKASDIYLLGAILYEIVTGFPPHAADTVTECLMAAADNVIVRSPVNSRLKQIALKAMASSPKLRYPSVAAFQEDIRKYQETAQSLGLSTAAQAELEQAIENKNYEQFSRALFGFQDALALWDGNEAARKGIGETKIAYATCALAKHDYDLGLQQLDPGVPEERQLYDKLKAAKQRAEKAAQNAWIARTTAIGLLILMLVGAGVGMVMINAEKERVLLAKAEEEKAREEAEEQKEIAEQQSQIARDQTTVAEMEAKRAKEEEEKARLAEMEARDAEMIATMEKMEAERQKEIADNQTRIAERQKGIAERQTKLALLEEMKARFANIFSTVGLSQSKIEANDISSAVALLRDVPEDYRGWEWKHLHYLCHPDVPAVASDSPVTTVDISRDGTLVVFGNASGQVRVHGFGEEGPGELLASVDLAEPRKITAVRFQPDGQRVWIGSQHEDDYLLVWEMGDAEPVAASITKGQALEGRGYPEVQNIVFHSADNEALVAFTHGLERVKMDSLSQIKDSPAEHVLEMYDVAISPQGTSYATVYEVNDRFLITERGTTTSIYDDKKRSLSLGDRIIACQYLDEQTVAFATVDGAIYQWKPATQVEEYHPIDTVDGLIHRLQYDADRKVLAASLNDGTIQMWRHDTEGSFRRFKRLRGHHESVTDSVLSPDRSILISASEDSSVRFWDYEAYLDQKKLEHRSEVRAVGFSSDSSEVLTGDASGQISIWPAKGGQSQPVQVLSEGDWTRQSLIRPARSRFTASRQYVAMADPDLGLQVWDSASGRFVLNFPTTSHSQMLASFEEGDRVVFIDTEERPGRQGPRTQTVLRFADVNGQQRFDMPYNIESDKIAAIAISPSGKRFAVAFTVGVHAFDMEAAMSGNTTPMWRSNQSGIKQLAFLDDETLLLGTNPSQESGRVEVVDIEKSVTRNALAAAAADEPPFLLFQVSPDRSRMAVVYHHYATLDADTRSLVRIFDLKTGSPLTTLEMGFQVHSPNFSPDGQSLYFVETTSEESRVWKWDTAEEAAKKIDLAHLGNDRAASGRREIASVATAPDDANVLQVAYSNRDVEIWDVARHRVNTRLNAAKPVILAEFISDDKEVVSVHNDGIIRVWDRASGEKVRQMHVPYEALQAAARRGDRLAVGGTENDVVVFELSSGEESLRIENLEHPVSAIAWLEGPEKTYLIVSTEDGVLRRFDAANGQMIGEPFSRHDGIYTKLTSTPDGSRFAAASTDKTVRVWLDAPVEEMHQITPVQARGHSSSVSAARFSDDGKRLITGSEDSSLIVWFVGKPEIATPDVLENDAQDLDDLLDEEVAVAIQAVEEKEAIELADDDAIVMVREFVPLKGHRSGITAIAFSPDQSSVATAGRDRQAIVWYSTETPITSDEAEEVEPGLAFGR